jgi:hypothetical protein
MATPKKFKRPHQPIPFEEAIRRVMSAPPQHKTAKPKKKK